MEVLRKKVFPQNYSAHVYATVTTYTAEEIAQQRKYFQAQCGTACLLNPVIFKNGTTDPDKIDWKFDETVEKYYNNSKNFNKRMKTELVSIVKKLKSEMKFPLTNADVGKTLDEIEKVYSEATSDAVRVALYCLYYEKMFTLYRRALHEYCGLQYEAGRLLYGY